MMADDINHDSDPNRSMKDPSRFRPSPKEFRCGEELDDDGGSIGRAGVLFFCTLPEIQGTTTDGENAVAAPKKLAFACRDRSSGVLESQEAAITNDEFEATQNATAVDPFFFDAGYTLAGRTGFQVWSVRQAL